MMLEVNKPLIKSLPKLYIKESAAIMRLNMSLKASAVCYLAALFITQCGHYDRQGFEHTLVVYPTPQR